MVGVENSPLWDDSLGHGTGECASNDVAMKALGELPAEYGAREEVDDDSEIEPALGSGNVGDVADDLMARSLRRSGLGEQIGRGMSGMVRRGCLGTERASWVCAHVMKLHETSDTIFRAALALAAQFASHARTAVRACVAMCVNGIHVNKKFAVGFGPGSRWTRTPSIVSRA